MFRIEGFSSEARKAFETLASQYPDLAGILYKFKVNKELDEMNFVLLLLKVQPVYGMYLFRSLF
jgi:hypothetical protein